MRTTAPLDATLGDVPTWQWNSEMHGEKDRGWEMKYKKKKNQRKRTLTLNTHIAFEEPSAPVTCFWLDALEREYTMSHLCYSGWGGQTEVWGGRYVRSETGSVAKYSLTIKTGGKRVGEEEKAATEWYNREVRRTSVCLQGFDARTQAQTHTHACTGGRQTATE